MLVFTEPMAHHFRCSGLRPNTCESAATSIGSPRCVPVPWASTYVIVSGVMPASAWAMAITSAWPVTLGAV